MNLVRSFTTSRTTWTSNHANYQILKNGVAVIKLDSPNSKVNTLNVETMNEVKKIMQVVSSDSDIHAAVLISGIAKEMVFI